ncbi:MAG: AcrR family transcriptional regulator [Phenylobacterium sp.]|jgi:AcrR family transcriptional regulator
MCPAAKFSPAEQESMILEAAAEVIEQSSLMDFTMSAIAKKAGISMGSIYKHVQTKEDVLIALDVMLLKRELVTYRKLQPLELTTPEKLISCFLLDYQKTNLHSFDVQLGMLVGNEAILKRGSVAWVERMRQGGKELCGFFDEILNQAVNRKELTLPDHNPDELYQLNTGLWALNVGNLRVSLEGCNGYMPKFAPDCAQILNTKRFINSFHWSQPLDTEGLDKVCHLLGEIGLR